MSSYVIETVKMSTCLFANHVLKRTLTNFVPKHTPATEHDFKLMEDFLFQTDKLVIVTGAGISTESGIPDYRSQGVGLYDRTNYKPIQHQEFLKSPHLRKRYWARNYVGWDRFSKCEPNSTHVAVKNLEVELGKVIKLITQNVDNLHYKAGSKNVIELHGSAYRVVCLSCGEKYSRHYIQQHLRETNPEMQEIATMLRPDGDVELSEHKVESFNPPLCEQCSGILKPDIVFFGDNVPKSRVQEVQEAVRSSDSILVLGSSLSVFSGYRIILQALEESKKIVIVNIGTTRADKHKEIIKIHAKCGDIMPRVCY